MSLFVLVFIMLAGIVVIGLIAAALAKILRTNAGGVERQRYEAEMIQDIHRGLEKMEERLDALETILLEKEKCS